MPKAFLLSISLILLSSVYGVRQPSTIKSGKLPVSQNSLINPEGKTINDRILTPAGYERIPVEENSFAYYLRHLPLKPHGSEIRLYSGQIKTNTVHVAVIDMDIGIRDLQQCADAIIRLRAEYLYRRKSYELIHFNFTNGFRAGYVQWANGYRIEVKDNQVKWIRKANMSYEYDVFRQYLDIVFTYAGTFSLEKELEPAEYCDIHPGDVLIRGGSPGHAVIVADVAVNPLTEQKLYLLTQSYIPAQDIHVLKNPANRQLSPWYEADLTTEKIQTPEWDFSPGELRRFQ